MNGYISIRLIADDLLEHPMLLDLTFERIVNHAVHFLRKMGVTNSFLETVTDLEIKDYRAVLPCDYYKMIQVKMGNIMFRYATSNFHMEPPTLDRELPKHKLIPDLTYKVQNNVIYTSIKDGVITISYYAMPVDDEGFPMIPDDSSFTLALEAYIKVKHFEILFDLGKVTAQSFENAKQDYAWEVGLASTKMIMPSVDEMESISNMWNTLVPRVTEHKRSFDSLGTKEYIRRH